MSRTKQQRSVVTYLLAGVLVLGQLLGFVALPTPAKAAPSADPNAEIVYIDDNGVIRVLDTQGDPLVQWFSPDGGWDQIALLDVTQDGDMEILALDIQGETSLRVTVFDPVLAVGSTDPSKQINGIPWDILWTTTIQGEGEYIVTGDFDTGIPGDEFAVGFRNGDTSIVQIYNANSLGSDGKPTGRDWKVHIQKEYPETEYTFGVSGQLNDEGADELVLFDSNSEITRMDIYRPDQDMFLTDSQSSSRDRFKFGATGQLEKGGREELAVILSVANSRDPRPSLQTYVMGDDGEIEEDLRLAFTPNPEWVFLADIRGNGDDEVFFLRNYQEGAEGPRLIMRDDWGDDRRQNEGLIEWALMEDGANNEFRAGAGGDVDGDGRDEIILMRNDRIRVYHRPETGNEESSNYNDYRVNTDNSRINLLVGDLDRIGFTTGPILMITHNLVEAVVPAGGRSAEFAINITNIGTDGGVPINASIPPGNSWVQMNPTFSTTPAIFRIRFDAANLDPGQYSTTATFFASGSNIINNNLTVLLRLTVVPPVIEASPPILNLFRFPCEQDPCSDEEIAERNEPFTTTIELDGTANLAFRVAVMGVPPAEGDDVSSAAISGLAGPVTGGIVDDNGNIILYDNSGNSTVLAGQPAGSGENNGEVNAAQALSRTVMLDPLLTWVTGATVDSSIVPADLALGIDPSVLTEKFQREHAVIILVADTRGGTPNGSVTLIPIQLANIGHLLWAGLIASE